MHLAEAKYLGYLHLLFKKSQSLTDEPEPDTLSKEEILLLLDELLLFDDATSYQAILGMAHHLQLYNISIKLEVARKIMTCMFSKGDIPQQFHEPRSLR